MPRRKNGERLLHVDRVSDARRLLKLMKHERAVRPLEPEPRIQWGLIGMVAGFLLLLAGATGLLTWLVRLVVR